MADVWLPGAHIDRGRNAGYNSGRSQMRRAVAHYTVGSDSRNVGRDGYFHWLVHRDASREGGCTQYAEIDAITWHAADAGNPYGPGIEWERNVSGGVNAEGLSEAEPLTDNQLDWGARIIDFCAEHGITPELYGGPRYGAGGWDGWVNHQAIDSSRSDGLLRWEWDAMAGGGSPPDEPEPGYSFPIGDDMYSVCSGSTPNSPQFQVWWDALTRQVVKQVLGPGTERIVVRDLNLGVARAANFENGRYEPFIEEQWLVDDIPNPPAL